MSKLQIMAAEERKMMKKKKTIPFELRAQERATALCDISHKREREMRKRKGYATELKFRRGGRLRNEELYAIEQREGCLSCISNYIIKGIIIPSICLALRRISFPNEWSPHQAIGRLSWINNKGKRQ